MGVRICPGNVFAIDPAADQAVGLLYTGSSAVFHLSYSDVPLALQRTYEHRVRPRYY